MSYRNRKNYHAKNSKKWVFKIWYYMVNIKKCLLKIISIKILAINNKLLFLLYIIILFKINKQYKNIIIFSQFISHRPNSDFLKNIYTTHYLKMTHFFCLN